MCCRPIGVDARSVASRIRCPTRAQPVDETRRFTIEKYVLITVFARLRSTVQLNVCYYRYGTRVVHCCGRGLVSPLPFDVAATRKRGRHRT